MSGLALFNPRGVKPEMRNLSISIEASCYTSGISQPRHFVSEQCCFYPRSIRAYALCAWMDSKFSMSTL